MLDFISRNRWTLFGTFYSAACFVLDIATGHPVYACFMAFIFGFLAMTLYQDEKRYRARLAIAQAALAEVRADLVAFLQDYYPDSKWLKDTSWQQRSNDDEVTK